MVMGIMVVVIVGVDAAGARAGRSDAAVVGKRRRRRKGGGCTASSIAIQDALGEIAGEVPHDGVERASPEQLQCVLPLVGADESGVGDDLERSRFERLAELPKPLLLPGSEEGVELVGSRSGNGDLEDVMVEGLGVLYVGRERVVLIVQFRR